ncbi:MAG: hypothetical protein ACYCPQ_06335 [Elusimicrobiota bacterium]
MSALLAVAAALLARPSFAQTYTANPKIISLKSLTVFYDTVGPLSSLPMTRRDLSPGAKDLGEVFGESCQHELNVPTAVSFQATTISAAAGNGSYQKAVARIAKAHPGIAGLYDVKVDVRYLSVFLSLYSQVCTEVLARAYALPQAAAPSGQALAPAAKK